MMSRSITAITSARPSPGTPNACSTATDPPSTKPSSTPEIVTTGSSAFGSAWRITTIPSRNPFARAVRTKSSPMTSSRQDRDIREIYAPCASPRTRAGPITIWKFCHGFSQRWTITIGAL